MTAPLLSRSRRTRRTPFTDRVTAAGVKAYTVYNHMLLPTVFRSVEEDYHHLKSAVQLWDVACERQIELRGPHAQQLLQLTSPRDISRMAADQCYYVPIVDVNGGMINDPIVLKLAADRFWVSIADSDLIYYYKGLAGGLGLDVQVSEPDISPLAIQGPKADILVERLFGREIRETKFFRHKTIHFQGQDMVIARSGWSRQNGFEIYVDGGQHGPALWDHIMAAGEDLDIRAGCPNGIERIEGGLISYGNDVTLENTPFEADLGKYVQLDRVPTCRAREALLQKQQPERQLRAVEIAGDPLPGCTEAWPLRFGATHAGHIGSAAYSPDFKTNIGIAMVEAAYWDAGTTLVVQTPAGPRDVLVRAKYWI
jgi:dimethylsulfoniopropionate demethylase